MTAIEFRHVEKTYANGTQAVHDLSLVVESGELMVLLGPSGCGKSTIMRMLAGLEDVSGGELLLDGRVVNLETPQQRNVAMVFQNYALYPHMTVRANLEFPLRMRKLAHAEIEKRVDRAARSLGLEALLERRPDQLSGGQRQRVAMGRAIVRDPAVFLMDEPLSNLDAKLRVQVRNEIATLQRRLGTTTLYVTHDQAEAMTLGHRVAVLRAGRLQQVAAPQTLYDHPANVFVAGFLGSPPMNLFSAHVESGTDGGILHFGGERIPLSAPASRAAADSAIVGLRPEAFFRPGQRPELPQVRLHVEAIEALGHEQVLFLHSPAPTVDPDHDNFRHPGATRLLAARLPAGDAPEPGDAVTLALDPQKLYWFDTAGRARYADGHSN